MENDFFIATQNNENEKSQKIILDKKGKEILVYLPEKNYYLEGAPYFGLIKMGLYKHWIPERSGVLSTSSKRYVGYMNLKGEMVINDTTYKYAGNFINRRAIIRKENREQIVINVKGEIISNDSIREIENEEFRNGFAIAAFNNKWGIVDTNLTFIVKPIYKKIVSIEDDYFIFKNKGIYEIKELKGKTISTGKIQKFDRRGFRNGMLNCIIDKKFSYINREGQVVWQSESKGNKDSNLNLDYMNRGYFHTHLSYTEKGLEYDNEILKKIINEDADLKDQLYVKVLENKKFKKVNNNYVYYEAQVVNSFPNEVEFSVQDGRLYMKVQAKNEDGEWKDIEYLPHSWCGNSYYRETLKEGHYWSFTTPKYDGDFKTKFRIELKYIDPNVKGKKRRRQGKEITVYSNEYDGSVNPGQFWRKEDYNPTGLMDSYFD